MIPLKNERQIRGKATMREHGGHEYTGQIETAVKKHPDGDENLERVIVHHFTTTRMPSCS